MSSNAKPTNTSTAVGIGGTNGSKFLSNNMGTVGIVIFGLISVGMFIGSFVSMSSFIGSKDDWNVIQPQITKIWILTIIGTVGLTIASLLYFIQDSARTIYYILVLCCVSLGLSFSALAVAAISR
jgi:hypothetical protein